ncbi:MAG: bifunctional adenosylcobinamide kinase/adenosylcobinamide-phosphate guanylyltransferase [Chloroflexota bacterium]
MGRIVLILGGARSGKSSLAERMARKKGGRVTFVATAQPYDDEMRHRIDAHRAARPADWMTVEEPLELAGSIDTASKNSDVIIADCLTLWVSNHLCSLTELTGQPKDKEWPRIVDRLGAELSRQILDMVAAVRAQSADLLVVSNEVGLGLVPSNAFSRAYRDLLGAANRQIAAEADKVLLMVAGLPVDVKRLAMEPEL